MHTIRDKGLLDMEFLSILPNSKDKLPSFYQPIREQLIEEFKMEKLVPMKKGGYAAASKCYRGSKKSKDLSNLIQDEDLAVLLNSINANQSSVNGPVPPLWIKNPQIGSREENFLSMLDISEWTIENFIKVLRPQCDMVMNWLEEKSKEGYWSQEFYELLGHFLSKKPLEQGLKVADYIISTDQLFLDSSVLPKSVDKAKLIWQTMRFLNDQLPKKPIDDRLFVQKLKETEWVPQVVTVNDGNKLAGGLKETEWVPQKRIHQPLNFVQPCDASADDLPKGFPYETGQGWLKAIEFGIRDKEREQENEKVTTEIDQICEERGISRTEALDELRRPTNDPPQNGEKTEGSSTGDGRRKPPFPVIANPAEWAIRFAEELANLPPEEYKRRTEVVRVTAATAYTRAWLNVNYTNDEEQMVCQMCESEMPFKKREGEYYFVPIVALTDAYFTLTEHEEAQFLALCPECAAKYREFVWCDEKAMTNLADQLIGSDSLKISLQLGKLDASLRFVEWHWQAIKKILKA